MPFKYICNKGKVLKVQIKAKPKKLTKKDIALISTVDNRNEQRRLLNVYRQRLEDAKAKDNLRVVEYINKFIDALKAHKLISNKGEVDKGIKALEELQKIKEKEKELKEEEQRKQKEFDENFKEEIKRGRIEDKEKAKKKKEQEKIILAEAEKAQIELLHGTTDLTREEFKKKQKERIKAGLPEGSKTTPPTTDIDIPTESESEIIQTPIGPVLKGKGSDALYNDQIDTILKGDDKYLGCGPSDKIPIIPEDKPSGFVMNLDKTGEPGSHWTATYIDPTREKTIEYFDPFGKEPPESWMSHMKQLAKTFPHMMKLKINTQPNQNINSDNCGWISSWFLIQRFNGVPYIRATNYKEKNSADNNEKDIKNIKNNVFPYI